MELSDIRAKIDAVDDQLLALFLERMDLADQVAAYNADNSKFFHGKLIFIP